MILGIRVYVSCCLLVPAIASLRKLAVATLQSLARQRGDADFLSSGDTFRREKERQPQNCY